MRLTITRAFLPALLLLGFVLGCSKSQTEVKPDPAMAGKPFPKTGGRQTP